MSNHIKPATAFLAAFMAIAMGACAHIPVRPNLPDDEEQEEKSAVASVSATKDEFDNQGLLSSDLQVFDASKVRAHIGNSSINFTGTSTTVVAVLKNGSTAVASSTFAVSRSGDNVYFTNPAAVTSWVRSKAGVANAFNVEMGPLAYDEVQGTNTFVAEVFYDADLVGGGVTSVYRAPRSSCSRYCAQQ